MFKYTNYRHMHTKVIQFLVSLSNKYHQPFFLDLCDLLDFVFRVRLLRVCDPGDFPLVDFPLGDFPLEEEGGPLLRDRVDTLELPLLRSVTTSGGSIPPLSSPSPPLPPSMIRNPPPPPPFPPLTPPLPPAGHGKSGFLRNISHKGRVQGFVVELVVGAGEVRGGRLVVGGCVVGGGGVLGGSVAGGGNAVVVHTCIKWERGRGCL